MESYYIEIVGYHYKSGSFHSRMKYECLNREAALKKVKSVRSNLKITCNFLCCEVNLLELSLAEKYIK